MSAPLNERLGHLAIALSDEAWNKGANADELREFLRDHAQSLADLAHEAETKYAPLSTDGDMPSNAQALALGRFLRGHFRHDDVTRRIAHIARGGAGLGDDYLHVRFGDGYEGGIDREGRVST